MCTLPTTVYKSTISRTTYYNALWKEENFRALSIYNDTFYSQYTDTIANANSTIQIR